MASPVYIFAGGGTGGHLYPGVAVAGELARLRPEAKAVFACSDRPIDRLILDETAYAVVPQPVRPMPRRIAECPGFVRAYLSSAAQARRMIADLRPAAVLGLGGFAAGPVVYRAAKTGVRTGLLNPDAIPGRANRLLAGRVDAIFTQFSITAEHLGRSGGAKVHLVGCPVRREFALADRGEAIGHFGLREDLKTLLVNGGSLGARSINEAIGRLAAELDEQAGTWQVLHVTGPSKTSALGGQAGGLNVRVLEYCRRMDLAYAAADLALSRAGAGTVAELAATGTPAVLMPYPYHADQHQRLNAAGLSEAGAAVICEDGRDADRSAEALRRTLLPILREPDRLARMTEAASQAAPHNAAEAVARWLTGREI
ncbi:MAG: UDP-N-acetylglucosamine--N-acetylmuramyl-(pentapeptide) pyrophosphoryl-undecaprenol N-acetylglucosamine transferase [Phycisphaerae bacterium]